MSNPFQDQLLKTGLVIKKQANKARQDKNKHQHSKNNNVADETKINVQPKILSELQKSEN